MGVGGRWREYEKADRTLVEDQLVASEDAGGGLRGDDLSSSRRQEWLLRAVDLSGISVPATVTGSRTNSDGMLSKYSQFRTCFLNKKCFIHSADG